MKDIKKKYLFFIAMMLMATTYLPVVFNNLPSYFRSHHLWAIIWGLSLIFLHPQIFTDKTMFGILIYGLLFFIATATIWKNMDSLNYSFIFKEFYNIVVGASVLIYFLQRHDYRGLAKLTKWSMIFLCITAFMTIISSAVDPLYARDAYGTAVMSESEKAAVESFKKLGGANYSTAAAYMAFFPLVIYYYRHITKSIFTRKQLILSCVLFFIALIGMQIFANILIAVFASVLALIGMKNIKKSFVLISLFVVIILSLPRQIFTSGLISMSEFFESDSDIRYKLQDLAVFIEVGAEIENSNTGAGLRAERFPKLWRAFKSNLLFGYCFFSEKHENVDIAGYHLHWMNKLSTTGVIGLLTFLAIPLTFIRKRIRFFDTDYKTYYVIASLSILSYGIIKTIAGRDVWYAFFILLPGIYYFPLLKDKSKLADKSGINP